MVARGLGWCRCLLLGDAGVTAGGVRTSAAVAAGACSLVMQELVYSCLRLGNAGAGTAGWLQVCLAAASSSYGICREVWWGGQRWSSKDFQKLAFKMREWRFFECESNGDWFGSWHCCAGPAAVNSWISRRLLWLVVRTQTPRSAAGCWKRNRDLSSGWYLSLPSIR